MAGRPKFEITQEIIEQVEKLAAQGLSQEQIGSVIGCSPDTICRKKKENKNFAAAIKRGQHKGVANVTNALYEKAIKGDNIAMIFYLKNRDRENWKDKIDNTHSGPDGGPVETITRVERVIVDTPDTNS
jgi:hypothetical protein